MPPTSTPVSSSTIQQALNKATAKRRKPRWRRGTGVEDLIINHPEIAEWYCNGQSLSAIRINLKARKIRCCRTTIQKALVELGCTDELAKRRTKQP